MSVIGFIPWFAVQTFYCARKKKIESCVKFLPVTTKKLLGPSAEARGQKLVFRDLYRYFFSLMS